MALTMWNKTKVRFQINLGFSQSATVHEVTDGLSLWCCDFQDGLSLDY